MARNLPAIQAFVFGIERAMMKMITVQTPARTRTRILRAFSIFRNPGSRVQYFWRRRTGFEAPQREQRDCFDSRGV